MSVSAQVPQEPFRDAREIVARITSIMESAACSAVRAEDKLYGSTPKQDVKVGEADGLLHALRRLETLAECLNTTVRRVESGLEDSGPKPGSIEPGTQERLQRYTDRG